MVKRFVERDFQLWPRHASPLQLSSHSNYLHTKSVEPPLTIWTCDFFFHFAPRSCFFFNFSCISWAIPPHKIEKERESLCIILHQISVDLRASVQHSNKPAMPSRNMGKRWINLNILRVKFLYPQDLLSERKTIFLVQNLS